MRPCDTEFGLPVILAPRGRAPPQLTARRAAADSATLCVTSAREVPVTVVQFPAPPAGAAPAIAEGVTVAAAVDRYLDSIQARTTRDSYAETLARLTALAGDRPAAMLVPEDYAAVMGRWDGAAAATWNRHLSALTSFTAWAGRQEILTANPARRLERRKPARRGDRLDPPRPPGQAAHRRPARPARAGPVADALRDRRPRRGDPVPQHRGPRPGVPARPRHLQGRRDRVRPLGHRHRPPPAPAAARTHLRAGVPRQPARARVRFASPCRGGHLPGDRTRPAVLPARRVPVQAGRRRLDPHKQGWTLHQLRHSALQHLAADGRTAPELQAKSRHLHLGSLGRYVQLGEQTSAQVTADADPAARRRTR